MKQNLLILLGIIILLNACGHKTDEQDNTSVIDLNENSVTVMGTQLEQSVLNGIPDVFNKAFDQEYLKSIIRDNSIVNSSLDADFGKEYFESNFHIGDEMVELVNNGGDFKFVQYYFDENHHNHHIVFRSYNDFVLNFYDYIVDTLNNKLVIKDGFIYNTGTNFSDNIRENVLLMALNKTNPEGITLTLSNIKANFDGQKYKEALRLLREHQTELKDLSCYWQLYIATLYQTCPKESFLDSLNTLGEKNIDRRMLQLHQLIFSLNEGKTEIAQNTINELIEQTGDDPIYLMMFGKANFYAKNYKDALICYETSEQYLPPLWDLWYGKLECLDALNDKENFVKCLNSAINNYKMSKEELTELTKKHFPKMAK